MGSRNHRGGRSNSEGDDHETAKYLAVG
jgi:hypothetical protein